MAISVAKLKKSTTPMKPTAELIGKPIKTKKRLADPNTKAVIAVLETVTCIFCWMTPP